MGNCFKCLSNTSNENTITQEKKGLFRNLCNSLSKRTLVAYSYEYIFAESDTDKLITHVKRNKNKTCSNESYIELSLKKDDTYWAHQIQEWIVKCEEFNDNELEEKYSEQKTEDDNRWNDFKKHIKMLFNKLKDENQYNDDKWKIVNFKLLQLKLRNKNMLKKEQISLHRTLTESSESFEIKMEEQERKEYKNKLIEIINQMHKILKNKNRKILQQQTENLTCCSNNNNLLQIIENCEPFKRIEIILRFYHYCINIGNCMDASIVNRIMILNLYEHQQLADDFAHVKIIHIDNNPSIHNHQYTLGRKICMYFESELPCKESVNCKAFLRHHRNNYELNNGYDDEKDTYIKDIAFQQDCHKLHSYFFHSTIKFGREPYEMDAEEEEDFDNRSRITCFIRSLRNESCSDKKYKKKAYIGKKEDNLWWYGIVQGMSDNQIYRMLVKKMGVFRAQSPHGFSTGQCRGIAHVRPKFKNIKQEVLHNEFEHLSCESWNQTLRKSTIFEHSWAGKKIRTKYKGYYDDRVSGMYEEWKEGAEIDIESIVTLKLYTDFDKLQFALKRCFRHETFSDILSNDEQERMRIEEIESQILLKCRLENFYHWRGSLLIVLNKYGSKLNTDNNMILYHGVNQKMLIKTQTFAFNGPFSTSLSYHVARTFGTAKGMVLKISSYFPQLNYCNAFDASLLSDYPEEQEWLIGFMYVRLLEVRTRKLTDYKFETYKDLANKVPLASWIREAFFCLHLFKEQIFSMSQHLERVLVQFLKVNRFECCKQNKKYENKYKYNKFEDCDTNINCVVNKICNKYHLQRQTSSFFEVNTNNDNNMKEDAAKSDRIFCVIWNKFNEFRCEPNRNQRIKFDIISNNLKRFFMDETQEINMKIQENKWSISWEEIMIVYPNAKEIHFINQYKLTDQILHNLIKCIKRKGNKLQKVLFLYYNYKNTNKKPSNQKIFQDPDTLDDGIKNDLKNIQWIIKYGTTGKYGYKIRLYNNSKKN